MEIRLSQGDSPVKPGNDRRVFGNDIRGYQGGSHFRRNDRNIGSAGKWLLFLFLVLLLFLPAAAFTEELEIETGDPSIGGQPTIEIEKTGKLHGKKALLVEDDMPVEKEPEGIHFERKYRLTLPEGAAQHDLPNSYVETVEGKERSGLKEHLMLSLYSNLRSKYVSKEVPDSIGPVWQPSATIEAYGLGLNVWANFVVNDEPDQGSFNEIDFTTYYTCHIGNLTLHPYVLTMIFPEISPQSLDYSSVEPLVETDIYLQYDLWKFYFFALLRTRVRNDPGRLYGNVGVAFDHLFDNGITISPSILMNFGNKKYMKATFGVNEVLVEAVAVTLAASWNPWRGLTFKPNINVAVHIPPSVRRAIENINGFEKTIVWGGLDLSYNF